MNFLNDVEMIFMKIQLGVIFGGDTVEHEVSIITAVQAMENMDQNKYDIIPIYNLLIEKLYESDKEQCNSLII